MWRIKCLSQQLDPGIVGMGGDHKKKNQEKEEPFCSMVAVFMWMCSQPKGRK